MGKTSSRSAVFLDRVYIEQKIAELRTDILMALDAKSKELKARDDKIINLLEGRQTQAKQPEKKLDKQPIGETNSVPEEYLWKLEMQRRVNKMVKEYPELYANFNTVLRRVYDRMLRTYTFVRDQAIKEYKNAHPGIERASCLDAISDNPQWRSVFESVLYNLGEDSFKEMERRRMAAEAEMGKTRQEIIQPLIEARGDKSNYGCATYTLVKGRLKKKGILYKNYEEGYRRDTGIKRHVSNGELIDNVPALKREFAKAVGELLAEQKVVKNDGN